MEVPVPPELRVTLVGFSVAVNPAGVTAVDRETAPENPFRLDNVTVAVPGEPDCIAMLDELLDRVKSGVTTTLTDTVVVCEIEPLVPVTVTV